MPRANESFAWSRQDAVLMEPLDPTLLGALADAAAFPHDRDAAAGVEVVQTHISAVFLTRGYVYKLRKAVDLGFVCFASRSERNADCLREVRLNRRLAPDVYLGVAPIHAGTAAGAAWQVGAAAEDLAPADAAGRRPEHCVVMRRLPSGDDGLSRLAAGRLTGLQLDAVARVLARFHAAQALGVPAPLTPEAWRSRLLHPARENFRQLARSARAGIPRARVEAASRAMEARFAASSARFETRRAEGRVVDGHGDVHLQHLWFEGDAAEPVLIDCIEFDDELRRIDAASEVAFLAMDLAYRGQPQLGERFLRSYATETDDFGLYGVVDWYASYRAAVRSKVAALAALDPAVPAAQGDAAAGSARRHLDLAEELLEEPGRGALVLLCGVVGTGKSSVAAVLADVVGGAVVSSDRTRKRLAGLAPTQRAEVSAGTGLYEAEVTERVYAALLERAAPVAASGRTALLDASFARRRHREAAVRWAAERGIPVHLVEVTCGEARTLARLARREAAGSDPSDAGPALHAWSVAHFEKPEEWPIATRRCVSTDDDGWREDISALVEGLPVTWHRSCRSSGAGGVS